MTGELLPNNDEQDATYDAANRLASLSAVHTPAPELLDNQYQYGYDQLGLTDAITTTVQGVPSAQTLTHDAAGRLTAVSSGTGGTTWGYDGRGNLNIRTVGAAETIYTYSASNPEEVASVGPKGHPSTFYGYDLGGDTVSITNSGTLHTALGYDAQQRLVQVTLGSPITETITMAYNAFGQRASYTVTPAGKAASLVESFAYQGDQLAQVAYGGTSVPTPYTDTYIYTQDI